MRALVGGAFLVGVAVGCLGTWAYGYSATRTVDEKAPPLSALLKLAPVTIPSARDHCEGRLGHTVGDVLGGLLDAGLSSHRNPYEYSCETNTCRFVIGNCAPWRSRDCGQTVLAFEVDPRGAPQPRTFSCLDVP